MSAEQQLLILLKGHDELREDLLNLFKTHEAVLNWINQPIRALNGKNPISLLETDSAQISDLIDRIKTGDMS